MKLTSRGRYAVMALADIAKNDLQKPTNLSEISLRQGISLSFLEHPKRKKNIDNIRAYFIENTIFNFCL